MGSRLAGELRGTGHRVGWVAEGRSEASADRARREGLVECTWADVAGADVVLCSCAPQGAVDVAHRVAASGFRGLYLDANPMGPATLLRISETLGGASTFVDAAVIGPPPGAADSPTHLVLSGEPRDVALAERLWAGSGVSVLVAGEAVGDASAAKAAFALYNKGRVALAVLARSLARHAGVEDVLQAQSGRPGAAMLAESDLEAQLGDVAWRWGPEFDEIAATVAAYGLRPQAVTALRAVWEDLELLGARPSDPFCSISETRHA